MDVRKGPGLSSKGPPKGQVSLVGGKVAYVEPVGACRSKPKWPVQLPMTTHDNP